LSGNKKNKGF